MYVKAVLSKEGQEDKVIRYNVNDKNIISILRRREGHYSETYRGSNYSIDLSLRKGAKNEQEK